MMFSPFRRRPPSAVDELYAAIVAQARQPHFYARLGVPDTVAGRFDMIALHGILLFHRLRGDAAGRARAQQVFDRFFADMDDSLREMAVGDESVPKKIKRMAELFYGAADVYAAALTAGDNAALAAALARNVYVGNDAGGAAPLAAYVRASAAALEAQSSEAIVAGRIAWIDATAYGPDSSPPA